jgi:hypothetical protein
MPKTEKRVPYNTFVFNGTEDISRGRDAESNERGRPQPRVVVFGHPNMISANLR